MINFGITLQDQANELPAEVAVWLLERNDCYPDVEFKVDYWDIHDDEADEHEKLRQRFSRMIQLRGGAAPLTVTFMYPKQNWHVRIIGNLTAMERVEIAQMPKATDYEEVSRNEVGQLTAVGIPLKSDEVPNDCLEFVPVEPHIYMTGLTMSGAELLDIVHGSRTERKDAIVKAMSEKNWDEAKELLKQRH